MKHTKEILGIAVALILYFAVSAGCDPDALIVGTQPNLPQNQSYPANHQVQTGTANDSVIIGSFNIQKFGRTKIGKSDVTGILVDIARRFDLLAIQELQSSEQSVIPRFVDMINQQGARFKYIVGPRQGYTTYKEQYVFVYDSTKIELIEQPRVAEDPTRVLHRSPLIARFRCLNVPNGMMPFTFTLMNIHTDPDEVPAELNSLAYIIDGVRRSQPYEDDLILLGDLNAPPREFMRYPWFADQYGAIVENLTTNTRTTRNIDNIVFDAARTSEFRRYAGVLNLMSEYQLSMENALYVSDHMPVWAVFSSAEAANPYLAEESPQVYK